MYVYLVCPCRHGCRQQHGCRQRWRRTAGAALFALPARVQLPGDARSRLEDGVDSAPRLAEQLEKNGASYDVGGRQQHDRAHAARQGQPHEKEAPRQQRQHVQHQNEHQPPAPGRQRRRQTALQALSSIAHSSFIYIHSNSFLDSSEFVLGLVNCT